MIRRSLFQALVLGPVIFAPLQAYAAGEGAGTAPCGIPYEPSPLTSMAYTLVSPRTGKPLILYSPAFLKFVEHRGEGAATFRYLLQHECGHQVLGHLAAAAIAGNIFSPAFRNRVELEADCYAAHELFAAGDESAVRAAIMLWNSMGAVPAGPGYPTGYERSAMLQRCFEPGGATGVPSH